MDKRLGEILVRKGLLSRDNLREALIVQKSGDSDFNIRPGSKLGRVLLAKQYVKPMALVRMLYEQKGSIDFIYIGPYVVEPKVMGWFKEDLAVKFNVLPLVTLDDKTLFVAANSGFDIKKIDEFQSLSGHGVEAVYVDDEDLSVAIKACFDIFKTRGVSSVKIGEVLVRDKYVTEQDLKEALEISRKTQRMLGKVLIETGKVNEHDFFHILSLQKKIPLVRNQDILSVMDKSIASKIPKAFCVKNLTLPYLFDSVNSLVYVVTSDPAIDLDGLKKAFTCKHLDVKLATYSDLEMLLRSLYRSKDIGADAETESEIDSIEDIPFEEELEGTVVKAEDVGKITERYKKLSNLIVLEAIKKKASDIHIEAYENEMCLRYRIDGILYDIDYLPINRRNVGGIVNVLKIESNLNIAERRLPQGGRFRKKIKSGHVYDFRVQTQPTLYGENIVLRILDQSSPLLDLDVLGFSSGLRAKYEQIIHNPSGLVLITGPTGSGKTTTLYSTLSELKKDLRKKILTIEDPIEYSLERVQQAQVKEDIGFTFAEATRSFLREDPDVMLVGEIRDKETAMESMRASETGHMVFSTLHTNDSVDTVQRLLDLDLNPATIAAELLAVISQRLAKKNCQKCIKPYKPSKGLLKSFYPSGVPKGLVFYSSAGCSECNFRGHNGRVAIMEFWFIDRKSKELITHKASFEEMYSSAVKNGMVPMIKDALLKVESGVIALDELTDIIPYFQILRWKEESLEFALNNKNVFEDNRKINYDTSKISQSINENNITDKDKGEALNSGPEETVDASVGRGSFDSGLGFKEFSDKVEEKEK